MTQQIVNDFMKYTRNNMKNNSYAIRNIFFNKTLVAIKNKPVSLSFNVIT